VTVLIGLRCVDGAVLACDSQETRGNYFRFWTKVSLLGSRFAVLWAGNPTLGEAFARRLDGMLGKAREEGEMNRFRTSQLIEEAILSFAAAAGEPAVQGRQLLIAGIADSGEVCLWALDAGEIYLRDMWTWECCGSGIDAAEMLMKDFYFPEITTQQAVPLLTYVVQAVGEICLDCGGPISIVVVSDHTVRQLYPEEVEVALSKVKPELDRLRKELPKQVLRGEKIS
jgi:20S proteasome alpha/beta subunit